MKINTDISSFHHGPPPLIVKWITQVFTTLGVPKRAGQDGDPEMWDEGSGIKPDLVGIGWRGGQGSMKNVGKGQEYLSIIHVGRPSVTFICKFSVL